MALIDFHDMDELKNRNEVLVWAAIEAHLAAHPETCRCRDCILDTAALALNRLPSRYQVYSFHDNHPGEEEPTDARLQEPPIRNIDRCAFRRKESFTWPESDRGAGWRCAPSCCWYWPRRERADRRGVHHRPRAR